MFCLSKKIKLFIILYFISYILYLSPCSALAAASNSSSGGSSGSSQSTSALGKFNNDLAQCKKTGQSNLSCWMGQDNGVLPSMLNSLSRTALGDSTNPQALGSNGAVSQINSAISFMTNHPPVSTKEYLADLGSSLGFSKPALAAQGIGFQALAPVLPIWKAFRNISYLAFVLIFVVVGFMIMFRLKVGSQTAISIEAALPRIVLTLILVTFSYAIASLAIDFIYILIYVLVGVFNLAGLVANSGKAIQILTETNLFHLVYGYGRWIFMNEPGAAVGQVVSGLTGKGFAGTGDMASWISGALFTVIVAAVIVFSLIKVFFSLLSSYVAIILAVIFAPLQLLMNALPGNDTFGPWFKGLLANIIAFPAIALMFLLAAVLVGASPGSKCGDLGNPLCVSDGIGYAQNPNKDVWTPPFLLLEGGPAGANPWLALISMGIIMTMPQILSMIKKAMKVEPGGLAGSVVGGLMTGPKLIGGIPGTVSGMARDMYYLRPRERDQQVTQPEQTNVPPVSVNPNK